MSKRIPFNLKFRPQIESGEYKVETKVGCPVRIVCWDMACELPILGLVLLNDEKAEEMAVGFTYEGTNLLGEPLYDKLFIVTPEPELTEFEEAIKDLVLAIDEGELCELGVFEEENLGAWAVKKASELLALAREQFVKDGYVIEKKEFHDAVEKVGPGIIKEVSENVDMTEYEKGRAEALKDLPRWRKVGVDTGQTNLIRGYSREEDELYRNGKCISLVSLEKLPGFKED